MVIDPAVTDPQEQPPRRARLEPLPWREVFWEVLAGEVKLRFAGPNGVSVVTIPLPSLPSQRAALTQQLFDQSRERWGRFDDYLFPGPWNIVRRDLTEEEAAQFRAAVAAGRADWLAESEEREREALGRLTDPLVEELAAIVRERVYRHQLLNQISEG